MDAAALFQQLLAAPLLAAPEQTVQQLTTALLRRTSPKAKALRLQETVMAGDG
jgi:hypothetical protein